MALKSDRISNTSRVDFFMNEIAERGGVVVFSTSGSGASMDQAQQLCTYGALASGKVPIGLLMGDMVNLDLTRQKLNPYKEEVQQGGKVTLWDKGEVVTNRLYPAIAVTAGNAAYLGPSGLITNLPIGSIASPRIGTFMSQKDVDGYAKVSINLPSTFYP
mgnify:FL=1